MIRSIAIFLLGCWSAFAQAPSAPQIADLTAYLGLSEQQASGLQRIYQARSQAVRQLWEQINQKQQQLNEVLNSAAPDAVTVGDLMIEIQSARRLIGDRASHEAARQVLNAAQRVKLAQLETALRLRAAIDQAVMTGLIEAQLTGVMIPPLTVKPAEQR
jgi:uncharacterized protein YoxC